MGIVVVTAHTKRLRSGYQHRVPAFHRNVVQRQCGVRVLLVPGPGDTVAMEFLHHSTDVLGVQVPEYISHQWHRRGGDRIAKVVHPYAGLLLPDTQLSVPVYQCTFQSQTATATQAYCFTHTDGHILLLDNDAHPDQHR